MDGKKPLMTITIYKNRKYLSFDEHKKFAKANDVENHSDWKKLIDSKNFPIKTISKQPWITFKDQWKYFGDFC